MSAVSSANGDIVWQIATNYDVSSGISLVNDKVVWDNGCKIDMF